MNYSNPFSSFPVSPRFRPQQQNSQMAIDQQQFRQFAMTLDDKALEGFAQQARAQGISEKDIQQGINFIKSL